MSDQSPKVGPIGGPPSDDPTQVFPAFSPPPGPTGASGPRTADYPSATPGAYPPPPPGAQGGGPSSDRRGVVIGAVAVVVLALLVTAVVLVVALGGDDGDAAADGTTTTGSTDATTEPDGTTDPDGTTTEPAEPGGTTEPAADDAVDRVVGSWSGTYQCAQGLTALELEIEAGAGAGEVTATFSFSAHPSNPGVPSGSFAMTGTASEDGGLVLEPGEWLDRPGRFAAVGLAAPLPTVPTVMTGTVQDAPGCTRFQVTRG